MRSNDYQRCLEICTAYILDHIDEEITAGQLAKLAGYNLSHFSYVFHAYTDMTLSEYVRSLRMRNAAGDLSGGRSVTYAAMNAGFQTTAGFSKAFTRTFGMTPMDYRKKAREGSAALIPQPEIREKIFRLHAIGYPIPGRQMTGQDTGSAASWSEIDFHAFPGYPKDMRDEAEFAAWIRPDPVSGEMAYFFGCLTDYSTVPEGFMRMEVPQGTYAVVNASDTVATDPPEETSIRMRETTAAVFREWLPAAAREGWAFDEKRPLFELYRKSRAWLYVPLIRK